MIPISLITVMQGFKSKVLFSPSRHFFCGLKAMKTEDGASVKRDSDVI